MIQSHTRRTGTQVAWDLFDGCQEEWDKLLIDLGAPILHQCFAWGEYRRYGGWTPLRMCARSEEGRIDAACQLLIKRKFGVNVVWAPGGPSGDISCMGTSFVQALRERLGALVYFRMNSLRLKRVEEEESLLRQGWRRPRAKLGTGLTLDLNLRPTQDERLRRTSGNWRHNFRRSSKYALRIERWERPEPAQIAALYREMEQLKGRVERVPESDLEPLLKCLGDQLLVYRALDVDGRTVAIRAAALFGLKAWDLLAAAGATARKTYATHATFWALAEACRQRGAADFDMGGADPIGSQGVFNFKQGTGALLIEYLGEWEYSTFAFLQPLANISMARTISTKQIKSY